MKQMTKGLLLLLVAIAFNSCALMDTNTYELDLTILHTNDHHGHYLKDRKGQMGMSARKTLLDSLRSDAKKNGAGVLLLSGGDINTGTLESDIFKAEPDFLGMRALGYDAMAVGNHEFDNNFSTIKKQMKWAGFPFLSANVYYKGTKKRVFTKPLYLIKEFNGIKVGIFGLTTTDTPAKASNEDARRKFDFRDPSENAKEIVALLKNKEKVDFIIVNTHMGHNPSQTAKGDIDLAAEVDGIDVIIGGHSQEPINAVTINNTIIVQAYEWGKYIGKLDLKVGKRKSDNSIKKMLSYKLIPVNLKKKVNGKRVFIEKEIAEDKKMIELFKPFKLKADKRGKKVIAKINYTFNGDRKAVRSGPRAIGQFVGISVIQKSKADIAVTNGGGIRSTLEKGNVTSKDLHNIAPFGNTISNVTFTKEELVNYVQKLAQYTKVDPSNLVGAYPHFAGMRVTIKAGKVIKIESSKEFIRKPWMISVDSNGKVTGNKDTFILALSSFIAKGGDNYPNVSKHPSITDSGFVISESLGSFIQKNKSKMKFKLFDELAKESITTL